MSTVLAVTLMGTLTILAASMQSTVEAMIQRNFGIHNMIVEYRTDPQRAFTAEDLSLARNIPGVGDVAPAFMMYNRLVPRGMEAYPLYAGVSSDPISVAANKVVEGRLPASGEVALPRPFSDRIGVRLGQTISLPFPPGPDRSLTVVGYTNGAPGSTRGGVALFDLEWLQEATGQTGRYQGIFLRLTDAADTRAANFAAGQLKGLFPDADVNPLDELRTMRRDMGGMRALAIVLGVFSLLASIFLIAGNFVISLRERTRELGALRAIGATRGVLFRVVLFEALFTGVTGSFVGTILAFACAYGLVQVAGTILGVDPAAAVYPGSALLLVGVGGVTTTLAAAVVPAFRASRFTPAAALGGNSAAESRQRGWTSVVGLALASLGLIAIVVAGASARRGGQNESLALLALAGGLLLFVGSTAGLSQLLPPLSRLLGSLLGQIWRHNTAIATRNVVRYPRQAKFVFASLSTGIALCLVVASVMGAIESTSTKTMQQRFPTPFVLQASGGGGVSPLLAQRVGKLAAVERQASIKQLTVGTLSNYDFARADAGWLQQRRASIEGMHELGVVDAGTPGDCTLAPTDLTALSAIFPFEVAAGRLDLTEFHKGGAVLLQQWADNLGLKPGDSFEVAIGKGTSSRLLSFRVTALVKAIPLTTVAMLVDQEAIGASLDQTIFVKPHPYATDEVREALKGLTPEFAGVEMNDLEEAQARLRREYGQRLAVIVAAAGMILAAAGASMVTLVLTFLHGRRQEFGLMRAAGASVGQVRRLVGLEILLVMASSALIALANSCLLTWALLRTLAADSSLPSVPGILGSLGIVILIVWVVVRIGMRYLDRASVIAALSTE